ncbi:MAG: hypothetical protein LDL13_00305, partial [Calditerrivibrio sp.]|nr:hypothetical protein [Calditerrivibrio sp.]MCA1980263.1 hypothetical protein [Calditerrivibrio sp.]
MKEFIKVFVTIFFVYLFSYSYSYSACSNYRDFVLINEVNTGNNKVELFVLPNIVPVGTTFTVSACSSTPGAQVCNSGNVTYNGTTNYLVVTLASVTNNKEYIDIIVYQGTDVVDYLNLYVPT